MTRCKQNLKSITSIDGIKSIEHFVAVSRQQRLNWQNDQRNTSKQEDDCPDGQQDIGSLM